jgi:inorganic pyrophosphatase
VSDEVLCVIEIPKGSRNKYEWDEKRRMILLDRFLSSSVVFPTDYGFVPESLGPDGEDPLDVLVAVSEPTFPGCGIVAKPVALLELEDQGEREPKVVCVPCEDPNWQHVEDLDDLPEQLVEEIAHFFVAYKKREGHEVSVAGWSSAGDAGRVIAQARERFAARAKEFPEHDR